MDEHKNAIPYYQLSILGYIIGLTGGFGVFATSGITQLFGFAAIFTNFEFICRMVLKKDPNNGIHDFLPEPSRFFNLTLIAAMSIGEALFIQPLWMLRIVKFLMYCVGFVFFLSSQSFRVIQQLEGYLKSPTVSLSFKNLRQTLRFVPLNQVSYYTCLLSLQFSVGNLGTFCWILFECVQELEVAIRQSKLQEAPPKTDRTYHGIAELPLLDGLHSPQNVLFYSFAIGVTAGFGGNIFFSGTSYYAFGSYLFFLGTFHNLEYISTAMYRHDVSLTAFLLNHSTEYHVAVVCSIIEFWLEWFLFRSSKQISIIFWIGALGTLLSQAMRTAAMTTAQSNFTHLVSYEKEQNHQLVTWGIYRYFRHPSYTGFFYWGVFMQLTLANPICIFGYAYALYQFFASRIESEEEALIEFFGDEYKAYMRSAKVYIPFL